MGKNQLKTKGVACSEMERMLQSSFSTAVILITIEAPTIMSVHIEETGPIS